MYCLIGSTGYLGSYFKKIIKEETNEELICVSRNVFDDEIKCDISNFDDVDNLIDLLKQHQDVKIIYLAAYHNPDLVEKNKELAWHINVDCLKYFIEKCEFVKEIYYISTDSVYGESVDFYHFKEEDELKPVNYYGQNKVAAEKIMFDNNRKAVRFPFLIGPSLANKKHFYDQIVETIKNNEIMEMYEDSYRSSLSFENAARLTIKLIENNNTEKVLNVCGDKDLSKYDVGLIIAEKEGLNKDLIKPIRMSKKLSNFETKRATSTLMDNHKLKEILNIEYIDIFDSVRYK